MADNLVNIAMPPGLHLTGGYIIEVAALNPVTGSYVSGVDISNVTMQVDLLSGEPSQLLPVLLIRSGGG